MNIRLKPDYTKMPHGEYLTLVLFNIEKRVNGPANAGLLIAGYPAEIVAKMIVDSVMKFKPLNMSPEFAGYQCYQLLTKAANREVN